jgi:hypothetical protein
VCIAWLCRSHVPCLISFAVSAKFSVSGISGFLSLCMGCHGRCACVWVQPRLITKAAVLLRCPCDCKRRAQVVPRVGCDFQFGRVSVDMIQMDYYSYLVASFSQPMLYFLCCGQILSVPFLHKMVMGQRERYRMTPQ